MIKLELEVLTANAHRCFENARNNRDYGSGQRDTWLIKGLELKARLNELIGKEISDDYDEKIIEANKKLKKINEKLKETENNLAQYADTVQEITDLVKILNIFIGLVMPV